MRTQEETGRLENGEGQGILLRRFTPFRATSMVVMLSYWYMLTSGFNMVAIGPSLGPISEHFHISLASGGLLFAAQQLPYIGGTLTAGIVSDVIGRRPVVIVMMVLYSAGMGIFALAPSWTTALLGMALYGLAFGAGDGLFTAVAGDLNSERRGFAMNLLFVFHGLGALSAPLSVGLVVAAGLSWRWPFVGSTISALAMLCATLIIPYPHPGEGERLDARAIGRLVRQPDLILICVQLFLYYAVEVGIYGWLAAYLTAERGVAEALAPLGVSLFWGGLTAGRLLSLRYVERIGYLRLVLICILGALVSLGVALLVRPIGLALLFFTLTGLFCSVIWPTLAAAGGQRFPQWLGTVNGLMIAATALGGGLFGWALGLVAAATSLRTALMVVMAMIAIMAILQAPLMRRLHAQGYR